VKIQKDTMRTLTVIAALLLSTAAMGRDGPPHPLDAGQGYGWSHEEEAKTGTAAAPRTCSVSYDRYRKIRQGAPYNQIKGYLHCDGELISSERVGYRDFRTYRFSGEKPGSFVVITFSDNLVNSTFQSGLQ
jgi:hypothetical protein